MISLGNRMSRLESNSSLRGEGSLRGGDRDIPNLRRVCQKGYLQTHAAAALREQRGLLG